MKSFVSWDCNLVSILVNVTRSVIVVTQKFRESESGIGSIDVLQLETVVITGCVVLKSILVLVDDRNSGCRQEVATGECSGYKIDKPNVPQLTQVRVFEYPVNAYFLSHDFNS